MARPTKDLETVRQATLRFRTTTKFRDRLKRAAYIQRRTMTDIIEAGVTQELGGRKGKAA